MSFSVTEKRAFKEVNEIIDIMGKNYKNKVPTNLLELLQKEEEKQYKTNIKKDLPFKEQKISRTALIILNYINTNYWLEESKIKKVKQSYNEKEENYQKILRQKYNPNEIFKKRGN